MTILLSLVSLTVGMWLGGAFRAFVLLPTSLVVVAAVIDASLLMGRYTLYTPLEAATIVAALQLGYGLGLVAGSLRFPWSLPMVSSTRRPARW